MYKNLEVLGKEKFKDIKFDTVPVGEVGKSLGLIPVGFTEIVDMCSIAPIMIFGKEEELEFIGLFGLAPDISVFNKQDLIAPLYVRSYPFINLMAKQDDEVKSVIGIDNNEEFVSKDAANGIFGEDGNLTKEASAKVEMVRELNRQRKISKDIVNTFKENDLLVEKDFKVKSGDDEKVIVEKFYMVDREKLMALDEATILEWTKKGWITLVDCHLRSLSNFGLIASA
jgi:hypothetical protein